MRFEPLDRDDFGGRSGEKRFIGVHDVIDRQRPTLDGDPRGARARDDRIPGDPGENISARIVGRQRAVADDKDIFTAAFGDFTATVQEDRLIEATSTPAFTVDGSAADGVFMTVDNPAAYRTWPGRRPSNGSTATSTCVGQTVSGESRTVSPAK